MTSTHTSVAPAIKAAVWTQNISTVSWVNSAAISDDGKRVVGGSFVHDYPNHTQVSAMLGTYAYDNTGKLLWSDVARAQDGVFAVGISGDGQVVAGGGTNADNKGVLKIYDGATGAVQYDSGANGIDGRVNIVSLSGSGKTVAAAANQLYLLVKEGGSYVPAPSAVPTGEPDYRTALGSRVTAVAVHPSGAWLVACAENGKILVATIAAGSVNRAVVLKVPDESINRNSPSAPKAPVRFITVAISATAGSFLAGGSDVVYQDTITAALAGTGLVRYDAFGPQAPVIESTEGIPKGNQNVRWVSASDDGLKFVTVANRKNNKGEVLIYHAGTTTPTATAALPVSPNGVSMNSAGTLIAVADGYPVGLPANIRAFGVNGNAVWIYPLPDMSWPVAFSRDGTAIVTGCDNGYLAYLAP